MNQPNILTTSRRVVVIYWKENHDNPFQVFSNLKNFCTSYPSYNYNTLNNYLSKRKTAYENDQIRIERKNIISQVVRDQAVEMPLRITPVVKKGRMKDMDQDKEDLQYWLSMPVPARAAAVTHIIAQSLKPGQRIDKSFIKKKMLKKKWS
jgi:hypothetical protein